MADAEGHIGTLLANLQSMRHLTTLELRLLQIQDEYQLLREFANSNPNKNAQNNMNELIDHLRDQLVINKVPIPDPLSLGSLIPYFPASYPASRLLHPPFDTNTQLSIENRIQTLNRPRLDSNYSQNNLKNLSLNLNNLSPILPPKPLLLRN